MFLSYEIIIFTETWPSLDVDYAELILDNFKMFRLDRNSDKTSHYREGDVYIAVKSTIISFPVIFSNSNIEDVYHVCLLFINSSYFIIRSTYLPPFSSLSVIESHLSIIDHILLKTHKTDYSVIILDDYKL